MTPDWLGAARRAAQAMSAMLAERPTIAERVVETGERGEGGDRTLEIDAAAERAVFAELERLHDAGARFTVVSEERGTVDYGGDGTLVIVDPIDGSLNAKRGMAHHALSIAVAEGPTMADVVFGFVYDLGAGRGVGGRARRRRARSTARGSTRRSASAARATASSSSSGSSRPTRAGSATPPTRSWSTSHRLRAMGTIAVTLCQVAGARLDGMATLRGCRAVDAAAGQLIVREAGGHVAFTRLRRRRSARPLDLAAALARGRRAHAGEGLRELARRCTRKKGV